MKQRAAIVLSILLCCFQAPASAHHTIEAKFNPDEPVMLNGYVTKVDWLNPHVHIFIDVANGPSISDWAVELPSQVDLERSGWTAETLAVGDTITVDGIAARDGSNQVWGNAVVADDTGSRLFVLATPAEQPGNQPSRPAPRLPDGTPNLGPAPGGRGYWGNPSLTALVETGVDVELDEAGRLADISDVDRVAPFHPWARDLYALRQSNSMKDDPMFLFCKPPGGPRQFQLPEGVQFVQEQHRERIWVMIGGGNRNWRFIYLDGRDQDDPNQIDYGHPLYYGRAVAEWDGDTLVVDTVDFNEDFWFSNGGLPHTNQLHLVERISRPDYNTLQYEVTIDDPGAYTRTWTSSWTLEWIPGEDLPITFCQDNRP